MDTLDPHPLTMTWNRDDYLTCNHDDYNTVTLIMYGQPALVYACWLCHLTIWKKQDGEWLGALPIPTRS